MTDPGKAQKLAPKVVKPTPILPAERGVLQFPAAAPIDVRQGTLTHAAGGLVTDDKPAPFRPRVSVFLGPGATFIGLADLLRPLYEAAEAAGGDAAPQPLNLARGFLQYNAAYLPAGTWDHHRVGLRLPLPIEIDSPGHWIVNARKILELSSVFNDKVSGPRLKTPPNPLFISEPDGFETEADIDVKDPMVPATIGLELWQGALRNPFQSVFLFLAVLRKMERKKSGAAAAAALAMLAVALDHQLSLLASTSAGNGILRCLDNVLKNAPSSTNPAEKAKGLAQLERALHEGPTSARTLVAHRELPATGAPKGSVKPKPLDTLTRKALGLEPKNGEHTRVLGYDVNVGQGAITYEEPITQRIGTIFTRFSGPDYAGRVDLAAYLKADGRNLNKNNQDAQLAARLEIIAAIADNLDRLDGVHTVDLHILNVGLLQWATDEPTELPVLLHRFKTSFPDEFDLFFALHRLDVRPDATNANRFILQKIGDDGVPKDMNFSELTVFFGKTIDQGRFPQTFSHRPEWAARFRLAALMSIGWRRVQVLEAARRFDRIRAEINGIKIGGRGGRLEVLQNVVTSKKGVALILDSFVVEPTRTKTELQALGLVQKPTATLDALDRSLTTVFEAKRPVSTPTTVRVDPRIRAIGPRALKVRNKIIDGRKLDVTHDSFKGW